MKTKILTTFIVCLGVFVIGLSIYQSIDSNKALGTSLGISENSTISETNTSSTNFITNARNTIANLFLTAFNKISPNQASLSAEAIITLTNDQRVQAGLPPLVESSQLDLSASDKAQDMLNNQYFAHISPGGEDVTGLATKVGYNYAVIGENLALGDFTSNQDLINTWMASPEHRANILNKNFENIGVAVVYGSYQGQNVWFAVQHFGLPSSVCPTVDQSLKDSIQSEQTQGNTLQSQINTLNTQISETPTNSDQYNNMIQEYNSLIANYTILSANLKTQTATYNQEVIIFNDCLAKFKT